MNLRIIFVDESCCINVWKAFDVAGVTSSGRAGYSVKEKRGRLDNSFNRFWIHIRWVGIPNTLQNDSLVEQYNPKWI